MGVTCTVSPVAALVDVETNEVLAFRAIPGRGT